MSEPSIIKPEDINPNYNWHRRVPSHGTMNVDYEERINFQRLHKYRIGRAKQALNNSKAGSLLCFDMCNSQLDYNSNNYLLTVPILLLFVLFVINYREGM